MEGVLLDMGTFGYQEGEPDNLGAMEDKPSQGAFFSLLSMPVTICQVGSLSGHTTSPYLRQNSLISFS